MRVRCFLPARNMPHSKDINKVRLKMILLANQIQKEAVVTTLISNKSDFKQTV
jgi:hypothetical protein